MRIKKVSINASVNNTFRKIRRDKLSFAVAVSMSVLFVVTASAALIFAVRLKDTEDDYAAYRESAEVDLSSLNSQKKSSDEKAVELLNKITVLNNDCDELRSKIKDVEKELEDATEAFANKDGLYRDLKAQLNALNAELARKENEISELQANIEQLENVYRVDINAQFEILSELNYLLENGAPLNKTVETPASETGEAAAGEETPTGEYPRISLYYEDIERGYVFSYNSKEVYYSASCIKAPFALSILQAASEEAEEIKRLEEASTGEAGGSPVTGNFTKVFDFDKIFTYTKNNYQDGSGVIKNEEYGTEYTYLELIQYMLRYSDNVAYKELKNEYGIDLLRKLAVNLKTTAMRSSLSNATAEDGAKVMKAIYEFIESDAEYSDFMYECMTTSIHTVMIPYAVYPKKVAHKYGWDTESYHDYAIVYDKHPYIVIFMSDMDCGGKEVDQYIQSVIKLVDRLHENFYKQK